MTTYPTFGRFPNQVTPQQTSVRGETGWWVVPAGWTCAPNPQCGSEILASPNKDMSKPVYYCCIADDGQSLAFQDLMLLKLIGQDNPYGLQRPI